jgi:hypothetical protein
VVDPVEAFQVHGSIPEATGLLRLPQFGAPHQERVF